MHARGDEAEIDDLLRLTPEEAIGLFRQLQAPEHAAMAGDFAGIIPYAHQPRWDALMSGAGLGRWLGKSYDPAPSAGYAGTGHNAYEIDGEVKRRLRFGWGIDASSIDGAPALMMHYSAFDNWAGQNDLIDELRVARPGVLLGLYHTIQPIENFTPPGDGERSGIGFFVLRGPIAT